MQQNFTKVFIADDHPIVAIGLKSIIDRLSGMAFAGHANNGDELFKALPDVRPDILLLDLNMPGNDFYRNIDLIKRDHPKTKIIVFTAYDAPELIKSLFETGVHGFLLKTATAVEIGKAIEAVVNGQAYSHVRDRCSQPPSDESPGPTDLLKDSFRKRLLLSRREQEILVLISKGLTSQLIGKHLFISKFTVETHRKNILRKLELNSSTELVKFAIQQGLV
ncbi:MAG: response regulator transcription factor [Saprospirales bacterium]|jgi:DNA-binding NarL/FixJ family response regulator|nr:response regulator transcription factor [Saprospirales bacterium]MBK6902129.1 response regulator transcription factor [Saprospirales bacterium]MBK7337989.1 response regulator transcription factor [Saprospirales bacterium]